MAADLRQQDPPDETTLAGLLATANNRRGSSDATHAVLVHVLARQAALIDLVTIDLKRTIRAAADLNMSQKTIARTVHLSQPRISQILSEGGLVRRPGFSGSHPRERAQRHLAGELTEAQVIDELGRWTYTDSGVDAWTEVERARDDGLISTHILREVSRRRSSPQA
jgi:hypothetical protein